MYRAGASTSALSRAPARSVVRPPSGGLRRRPGPCHCGITKSRRRAVCRFGNASEPASASPCHLRGSQHGAGVGRRSPVTRVGRVRRPEAENDGLEEAAAAFRRFFTEVRSRFPEREAVVERLELALLSREHVLLTGPPGSGKSALVAAVLQAIRDTTGAPSLFARQLTETTVQSDLVGPVDFRILTETGRPVHLLDEGMLGARFAFLD